MRLGETRLQKRIKIASVCNYGSVRSVCMAKTLLDKYGSKIPIATTAVSLVGCSVQQLRDIFTQADKVIVCNQIEIEENLVNEECDDREGRVKVIKEEFPDKMIYCEKIGRDIWQDSEHKDLKQICNDWIDKNEEKILK